MSNGKKISGVQKASPLERLERLYFIGIGGIGMSALARYFKTIGKNVAGYDKTSTELTKAYARTHA